MAYNRRRSPRRAGLRRRTFSNIKRPLIIGGIVLAFAALVVLFLALFTGVFAPTPLFTELPVSSGAVVESAGECIYYLKGTTLTCADNRGEAKWSTKFSAGQQALAVSESLVCLYNDSTATVIDTDKNPLFTLPQSDFQILEVVCGENALAVLTQISSEDSSTQYLRLFDASGKEVSRIDLQKAEVLDFGFSGSGDSLWYLTLDTSGVYPISQITTYSVAGNTMTGLYQIYDQLVNRVEFLQSDMYVCGTTYLTCYDTFGEKKSETLIYGTRCVATCRAGSDQLFALAPYSDEETAATVRVLSSAGLDTLIQLPSGVTHFALSSSKVYAYAGSTVYVYNLSGEFDEAIELEFPVESVSPLTSTSVLISSGEHRYIMNLK
ncbi:MAG: hypothetical protein IJP03_05080 [Christensenellaceae bacterium]|nr:hypothetical protein [Christensenellaceae bacterium]